MGVKQISIFVENKVGNLAAVAKIISEAGVSLASISLADTKDFGVLRLIVDDTYNAANALRDNDYIFAITPVIAVETDDAPGSLYKILTLFEENNINLEYLYDVSSGKKSNNAVLVFKVDNIDKVEELLKANGVKLLNQEDM